MMKKFEIKTCGTCICFMKSSCAYSGKILPESFACSKYQEMNYTSAPTKTEIQEYFENMKKEKNMKKIEIKTCGTCNHFMKGSCAFPTSKEDGIACAKYQTKISKPIMKEEQIHPFDTYDNINVYQINDDVIVANTIEEAIELWKKSRLTGYESDNIQKVELMHYNAKIKRQER